MSNSSTSILDPIPPYFGGTPGEDLRLATVEEWKANQSDYFQVLSAIMETEKFQTAAKYCWLHRHLPLRLHDGGSHPQATSG